MHITDVRSSDPREITGVVNVDTKLEAVVTPISDVDRAKEFYGSLGWRLDADFRFDNGFLLLTPPGSGCSVQFGTNITSAAPGAAGAGRGRRNVVRIRERAGKCAPGRGGRARRAREAHREADPTWPDWYAAYMVAKQAGTELPT